MNRLKSLREKKNMKQSELGKLLNVKESAISKYESEKVPLTADTLIKLSNIFNVSIDYLLGREDIERHGPKDGNIDRYGLDGSVITDILDYPTAEEKATNFSHQLALQMNINGDSLTDVAKFIGVTDEIVWEWLTEQRKDYSDYYNKLSEYFRVDPSYWTSPCAVSPGLEPTTQEYFLLMKYRFQNQPNLKKYIPIEDFFPNCHELSESELKWLNCFRQLNEDNQDIIIGEAKKFLKEQRLDSVAADEPLKKTGTDKLGK